MVKEEPFYEWTEPWEGRDESGKVVLCSIICRIPEKDVANYMRMFYNKENVKYEGMSDGELIEEFITIHWAIKVK